MTDREPDEKRRAVDCPKDYWKCPNMKDDGGGFEGERYRCAVCGAAYYLDYEDMK